MNEEDGVANATTRSGRILAWLWKENECVDLSTTTNMRKIKDTGIGFDAVYKNRSVLSHYKSGGLAISIRNSINFKWILI